MSLCVGVSGECKNGVDLREKERWVNCAKGQKMNEKAGSRGSSVFSLRLRQQRASVH